MQKWLCAELNVVSKLSTMPESHGVIGEEKEKIDTEDKEYFGGVSGQIFEIFK